MSTFKQIKVNWDNLIMNKKKTNFLKKNKLNFHLFLKSYKRFSPSVLFFKHLLKGELYEVFGVEVVDIYI